MNLAIPLATFKFEESVAYFARSTSLLPFYELGVEAQKKCKHIMVAEWLYFALSGLVCPC